MRGGGALRAFAPPAAIVLLGVAVLWAWSVPRAIAANSAQPSITTFDYYNFFLPRFEFGNTELERGRLPVWNPLEYAGIPFLATAQPAALYPPKIAAFFALESGTAMKAFLIFHYALLAAGFLVFARHCGLGAFAATAGAVYWTFPTTILLSHYHPNRVACMVWFPIAFVLADRVAKAGDRVSLAWLAVIVALQLTAGYPAFTLTLAVLLSIHAVVMYATRAWVRPPWRTIPRIALAFVLAALVAGLQVLPLAELGVLTERAEVVSTHVSGPWRSLRPFLNQRGATGPIFVFALFPGLAAFWLPALLRRTAVAPAIGLASCLLLLLGGWDALRVLPGFSMIRHNLVWLFAMQLYLAWLVALGAQRFDAAIAGGGDRVIRGAVALLGLCWAAICAANWAWKPGASAFGPGTALAVRPLLPVYGGPATQAIGIAAGVLLAVTAFAPGGAPVRRVLAYTSIGLILLGQLSAYPFGSTPSTFDFPPAPLRVREQLAHFDETLSGRAVSAEDRSHGYALVEEVPLAFGTELTFRPPRFRGLEQRLLERRSRRPRWKQLMAAHGFLDAMDVEWVVGPAHRAGEFAAHGLETAGRLQAQRTLFRNRDRMGRAWVVYGAKLVETPDAALEAVLASDFDPRREVLVEAPLSTGYRSPAVQPAIAAEVERPTPTRLDVRVDTPRPGVLVVSEAFHPGWVAHLDDRPAKLFRADYVLRGVEVPAGRHHVRFDYEPPALLAGALASGGGIALTVWLLASGRRRHSPESVGSGA